MLFVVNTISKLWSTKLGKFQWNFFRETIERWIEPNQTLEGHLEPLTYPSASILFNRVQISWEHDVLVFLKIVQILIETSLILWLKTSKVSLQHLTLPVVIRFHGQHSTNKSIEEKLNFQSDSVTVFATSIACLMPVDSTYDSNFFPLHKIWFTLDSFDSTWSSRIFDRFLFHWWNCSTEFKSRRTYLVRNSDTSLVYFSCKQNEFLYVRVQFSV